MKHLLLILLFVTLISFGQTKCNDIIDTVKTFKVIHTDYTNDSSWLQGVTFYEYYDNQELKKLFFAIAKMNSKEYVFCNISYYNQFQYLNAFNGTSGERFHKYIFNYKCDCE